MKDLLGILGYRRKKYRGDDFAVKIETMVREGICVIYERHGIGLTLKGERTGRRWERIQVNIPLEVEATQASQVALDLETAFKAMNYEYDIARGLETLARSKY